MPVIKNLVRLFSEPICSPRHWSVIAVIACAFIFAPQFDYNDWARNTEGLWRGLQIYDNPNAVYPPWGLILLWPYYLLSAAGSRVASVLVVGWLAARCRWSLGRFLIIVLSPFFIWTMLLSNVDLLALLLPVVLWESVQGKRWQTAGQMIALALLLIKPQGGFLLIASWVWSRRDRWRQLAWPLIWIVLLTVPVSLLGQPPLLLQWLHNLQNPSAENRLFWAMNNVSLSEAVGLLPAAAIIGVMLGGVRLLMRQRGRYWTKNHTYASLLLVAMLISPYTSNQSVIASLAFLPSVAGLGLQYTLIFVAAALGIYRPYDTWWTLLLGMAMLWLYRWPDDISSGDGKAALPVR